MCFFTLNVREYEINTIYSEYQQRIQAYTHGGNYGRLDSGRV